ncbi:hypothetical protein GCM10027440_27320 [Nocardiopsis coralliicola]
MRADPAEDEAEVVLPDPPPPLAGRRKGARVNCHASDPLPPRSGRRHRTGRRRSAHSFIFATMRVRRNRMPARPSTRQLQTEGPLPRVHRFDKSLNPP